ncbi:MAG: serine protease, partial [Ilumatobacteraceae bacterium]
GGYGQPAGGYGAGPGMAPLAAPPKSKKPMFIGAGIAVALLAGGIGFAATRGDDEKSVAPNATPVAVTTTEAGSSTTISDAVTTTVASTPPPTDTATIAKSVVQLVTFTADGQGLWTGSGTIISPDGLILTNAHVVENSGDVRWATLEASLLTDANLAPVPTYRVDVVAFDPALDLAVVKVSALLDGTPTTVTDLPFLPVGDSDAIGLGDHLRILGYPGIGGDTITFTEGSVAGFTSEAGVEADRAWVKTDATIAGGNSGGTAVNDAGELIAVPTRVSATETGAADCRVIQDTNGDNILDNTDTGIPVGGFSNGLRPTNLATALIEQARLGQVVSTEADPPVEVDTSSLDLSPPVFSADVTDDNTPTEVVRQLPSGTTKVCGFFAYQGMTDGVSWDAAWSINGEFAPDYSLLAQEWIGGASGPSWWVCAGTGEQVLPDGVYELSIYVGETLVTSNSLFVGDQYSPVDVNVTNMTNGIVCYLWLSPSGAQSWGPDLIGANETIDYAESATFNIVGGMYDVLAEDCDGNTLVETYGTDLTLGGDLTLTS